jgi:hypothetical protein
MSIPSPNQGIPEQQGGDPANLPSAQAAWDGVMENRLAQRYASEADRTARNPAPNEGEISHLLDVDRYEVFDSANWISLYRRSLYALIRKTADQTVNNSTVLVNDTQFVVPLPTAGIFQWHHLVFCDTDATADIKFAYTIPAGATMRWGAIGPATTAVAGIGDGNFNSVTASGTANAYGSGTVPVVSIYGEITMGGTAGNLQFQFAQNVAVVANTTVNTRSRLEIWRFS